MARLERRAETTAGAPRPIHFTFFVIWVGNCEINLAETLKIL